MNMKNRLDPELVPPLEGLLEATGGGFDFGDLAATRAMIDGMVAAIKGEAPAVNGVEIEDRKVPGPAGAPDVPVRVYRPAGRSEALPVTLWIHGGGWVLGNIELDDLMAQQMTKDTQCVVVSVEYRLAPEHPFPAPLDDCYAALSWLASAAGELNVDASRIAVAGGSAGGGLAAGLALKARDEGGPAIAFQLLLYPAVDDTNVAPPSESAPDTPLWTRENHRFAWNAYLAGRDAGGAHAYAAALRATDLSGLPPVYLAVGEVDLMRDENIEYARRLTEAGVTTEFHLYPGAFHAFDVFAPMTRVAQRFIADRDAALVRALAG